MKRQFFTIGILCVSFIFQACSSGKKAYQKGDYEKALYSAINRLRNSPNNQKAINTLRNAYPDIVAYYEGQVVEAKRSTNPLRWEKVMRLYNDLNDIYDEVQRAPAARNALPSVRSFASQYEEAKRNAAEARYALGQEELGKDYREAAKQAYFHFEKALKLIPGYRDAEDKMFEARDLATVVVEVEKIPMHSRTYELTNEFFEQKLVEYFRGTTFSPFIIFVTENEIESGSITRPDHTIRMQFDDFVVGQAYVKEKEVQRINDEVVEEIEISKDSTIERNITVKATMHQFTKEISSSGLLDVKIIDRHTNGVVSQQKFPGTFIWYDYWGYFNGDERALEKEDKRFLKKRREAPNPMPQDLFIEFTKPIFDQTTRFISNYYTSL